VRPWIRIPLLLLVVFGAFSLSGNATTHRSNRIRAERRAAAAECQSHIKAMAAAGHLPMAASTLSMALGRSTLLAAASTLTAANAAALAQTRSLAATSTPVTPAPAPLLSPSCSSLLRPLSDLLLELQSPPSPLSLAHSAWTAAVDFQPLLWVTLMIVAVLIWRRDFVRMAEVAALEAVLLTAKGAAQILTAMPDSNGRRGGEERAGKKRGEARKRKAV